MRPVPGGSRWGQGLRAKLFQLWVKGPSGWNQGLSARNGSRTKDGAQIQMGGQTDGKQSGRPHQQGNQSSKAGWGYGPRSHTTGIRWLVGMVPCQHSVRCPSLYEDQVSEFILSLARPGSPEMILMYPCAPIVSTHPNTFRGWSPFYSQE